MFASLDDPYMKARAPDMADAARRLTGILLGKRADLTLSAPSVVVAEDLSPSETLQLDKKLIRAFVTRRGSTNSHTAILTRTLKIPALVQTPFPLDDAINGKEAAVDGHKGVFYLEPDKALAAELEKRQREDQAEAARLDMFRGLPSVTKSGRKVELRP
ncbi:hypothetical protein AGMMS50255_8960 [Spirochaetia bacterium]|nr:hypothetical protein AGMMS50255_8960 [Spirochaetia bacterium]